MQSERQRLGSSSEALVLRWYKERGYGEVARNVSVHGVGELDLVLQRGDVYVVVEVRSLRSRGIHPLETLSTKKLRRMARTALLYFQRRFGPSLEGVSELRFDVVGVILGDPPEIIQAPNIPMEGL